jgi:hypothetical protein
MGAPNSEVGYTSAIPRRGGGPQTLYGHVGALGEKKMLVKRRNLWSIIYVVTGEQNWVRFSENPLPFVRFVNQKRSKTRKIYNMWIRRIQTMTSAMHVTKMNALFRDLFVESRSVDLLFKQLVTTIVRNESIQCLSCLILKTPDYLLSTGT